MNDGPKAIVPPAGNKPAPRLPLSHFKILVKFPALVAISLYMILLAGFNVVSVVQQHAHPLLLLLSPLFIAGALGLLLLLRWGWALTLAGVALMAGRFLWGFTAQHAPSLLVQGLLNLLFFFYLVRTEVREQLR